MREIMKQLRPGDHAALFYRSRAEQFAAAIPYIKVGLEQNERCLYIAGDNSIPMVMDAMDAAGIDVDRYTRKNQLVVATPEHTYLKYGIFEPEKMVDSLGVEVEQSLRMGYTALRGAGELGWAADLPSALLRLYEYESLFDERLGSSFVALCQYNETLFSEEIIGKMLLVHPKVVARGQLFVNPVYVGAGKATNARVPSLSLDQVVRSSASARAV